VARAGEAGLPAWLFEFPVNIAGVPENDVLAMTEDQATQRYMRHVGTDA
jgi:hypothetical protein